MSFTAIYGQAQYGAVKYSAMVLPLSVGGVASGEAVGAVVCTVAPSVMLFSGGIISGEGFGAAQVIDIIRAPTDRILTLNSENRLLQPGAQPRIVQLTRESRIL